MRTADGKRALGNATEQQEIRKVVRAYAYNNPYALTLFRKNG